MPRSRSLKRGGHGKYHVVDFCQPEVLTIPSVRGQSKSVWRVPPWSHLAGVGPACLLVLCPVRHWTYFFLSQPHPPVTPLGSSGTWPSPAWVFPFQSAIAQCLGTPFPMFLRVASGFLRDPRPSWRDSHGTSSCCRNSSLFRFFFFLMLICSVFKSTPPAQTCLHFHLHFASRHHGRPKAVPGAPQTRPPSRRTTWVAQEG